MRPTKHSYPEAGSRARIMEAVYAMWECSTSEASDPDFDRAEHRFWQAVKARERAVLGRLTHLQVRAGRARWVGLSAEQRTEVARKAAQARWSRVASTLAPPKECETETGQSRP